VEITVLVGPLGGVGDLVPVGGCGEGLGEQRVRIEGDAVDELVELLGQERRGRGLTLLRNLVVVGRDGRLALVGRGILRLLGVRRRRRGRLADDGRLGEGERAEGKGDGGRKRSSEAFIVSPFKASSGPVFLPCGWLPHALK
jgi:hypothetical protein